MGDFLRTILDSIHFLWPLAIISQWEAGVYLVFGRVWKVVGPGLYPKIPWFIEIHETSLAWEEKETRRLNITTKNGDTLTCEAGIWFRVSDPVKALTLLHDYENGVAGLAGMTLAQELAEVDAERFAPERRARLNTSCQAWVAKAADDYGLEVKSVSWTTFILKPRTYLVLTDRQ